MSQDAPFDAVDYDQLGAAQVSAKPSQRIRWWVVLLAALLCLVQSCIEAWYEFLANTGLLSFQQGQLVSYFTVAVFLLAVLLANPLIRLTRLVSPLNRAELISLFAALFVSAGMITYGLVGKLIPLVATPFNPNWNVPQREWSTDVVPYLNPRLFITDTDAIVQFRTGFPDSSPPEGHFWPRIRQNWNRVRFLCGRIPWGLWLRPIALWLIFIAAIYVMFYSLALLLFDLWSRRERVAFPHAQIPEAMLPDEDAPPATLSATVRDRGFLIAVLIVFCIENYTAACELGWLPGMTPIYLRVPQDVLQGLLEHSVLKGLADTWPGWSGSFGLAITVNYATLGIAFLLPLTISRSVWAYYLIALGFLLVAMRLGLGASVLSFPTNYTWENNFVTAIAGGAFLTFAAVCIAAVARQRWAAAGSEIPESPPASASRRLLRALGPNGVLFLLGAVISLAWLRWIGVSVLWGSAFVALAILIMVGLMRLVAETGIFRGLGPQATSFHVARAGGLMKFIPATTLVPLWIIQSMLFLNFWASPFLTFPNAFKMQEDTRAARRTFHLILIICLLVTLASAIPAFLYKCYDNGAEAGDAAKLTNSPQNEVNLVQTMVAGKLGKKLSVNALFYVLGGAWVVLSIVMRRRFFWWLHPIGLIAQASPAISAYWFSFFLGWFCKRLAIRYGGRDTFARIRPFFIGLIVGEFVIFFLWDLVGGWFQSLW